LHSLSPPRALRLRHGRLACLRPSPLSHSSTGPACPRCQRRSAREEEQGQRRGAPGAAPPPGRGPIRGGGTPPRRLPAAREAARRRIPASATCLREPLPRLHAMEAMRTQLHPGGHARRRSGEGSAAQIRQSEGEQRPPGAARRRVVVAPASPAAPCADESWIPTTRSRRVAAPVSVAAGIVRRVPRQRQALDLPRGRLLATGAAAAPPTQHVDLRRPL
jgi:hypothetical protein